MCRLDEPVIEGQETQVVEPLSEPDGARQVNRVEAPQSVTFGHFPGPVSEEVGDRDSDKPAPLRVESLDRPQVLPAVEFTFPLLARKSSPCFGIGYRGGSHPVGPSDRLTDCFATLFLFHVELDQGACVQIQIRDLPSTAGPRSPRRRPGFRRPWASARQRDLWASDRLGG